MQQIVN
jgi:hypothetical protein